MNETILTFKDALSKADKTKHLLLGNGFSISLFPDIFNYKTLSEKITNKKVKSLFEKLKTHDFEYVMRRMTEALQIIELYNDYSKELKDKVKSDIEILRDTLICTIATCHPETPQEIKSKQYDSCCKFLHNFEGGRKYTFNYDLLLYWVYMHCFEKCDNGFRLTCNDGFRKPEPKADTVEWEIGKEHDQTLYYLHGAMHIFSDSSNVEKYTWVNKGKPLSTQVKGSIANEKYPVFISEGTNEHKKMRINNNSYLGRGFSSLKSIKGTLFIHGHSLRDEDNHVFDYINQNSLKKIFISIFGDKNSEANQKIIEKINGWRDVNRSNEQPKKEYFVYDAKTANVWGND